ncbi:hypothetical protein [Pseudolysinimonas sp.]|uniref:hypothetical protein n=1 Tax=Pseudolysinimonas sp. TaxID=2680009 RepID=UPI0032638E09
MAPVSDGKTLGIVGLVLAFVFSIAGLIVSLIARGQSKRAGVENTPATVGIVISILGIIAYVIIGILLVLGFLALIAACQSLGTGIHDYNGATITCG